MFEGDEDSQSDSEVTEETHQSQVKRKIKEQRQLAGRQGSGIGISGSKTDIHPDLTLEKIHNPPDMRRGVLPSFGSRHLFSLLLQRHLHINFRSSRDSRGSRRSSELSFSMKEVLELNTMFEFGQVKHKK